MFYLLWNATIVSTSLFRISTGLAGGHGFIPTQRDATGTKNKGPMVSVEMEPAAVGASGGASPGGSPGRSRVNTVTTRATTSETRLRAESAFGYQFAAPEDLEPVELQSPPRKPLSGNLSTKSTTLSGKHPDPEVESLGEMSAHV